MRRYALRDDPWERIKNLLPGREGQVGVTAQDNRLFVEAVLCRSRAGIPWRDLAERFGAGKAVPTRFRRWAARGVWKRVCQHRASEADNEYARMDRTIVRAHQPRAGAPKKTTGRKPSHAAKAGGARKFRPPSMPGALRRDSC
jgi:transposase